MANYFPMARSWLMNLLPLGPLYSWEVLCHQVATNFESSYARPDNKVNLHAVQQHLGESRRFFF
jgi:hypothetical protein